MLFLWLKSAMASHISLENYKSLNRAYRVLTWLGSSDGTTFHVLLMVWSYWHALQVLSFLQTDAQAHPSS